MRSKIMNILKLSRPKYSLCFHSNSRISRGFSNFTPCLSTSSLLKTSKFEENNEGFSNFTPCLSTSSLLKTSKFEENNEDFDIPVFKKSLKQTDFFQVADLFTIEDLFNANVHLGHRDGTLNNYMRPYLFGSRLGHLIFDLDQTASLLRDALNFTAHISFRGGIVLFVCRSAQHQIIVEKTAEECQEYAHTREWFDKTFTDSTRFFRCVTRLPDLVIFLNTMGAAMEQHVAVRDCAKMLIPTIGIVDSNCDPRLITYPVPGNDDTHSTIKLYCHLFKNAINAGKQKRKEVFESESPNEKQVS